MKNREFIYEALEVIEENLESDINVYSISQQFGFSHYYFSRLFKAFTGFSLKKYIVTRKMSKAYNDIMDSDIKIIDIAFKYGFATHESFTRAFHKITGVNPSKMRAKKMGKPIALVDALTRDKIEPQQKNQYQLPEIVELDEITMLGIPFNCETSKANDFSFAWDTLMSSLSLFKHVKTPERYYQMQYWFEQLHAEFYYFFIGVEVERISDLPIQFASKTIPKQRYLKFLHRGKCNTIGNTFNYIYRLYLPETSYRLPHCYNFETYGDDFLGPNNEKSIIEIYIPFEED